jgi:hypothetical protein
LHGARARKQSDLLLATAVTAADELAQRRPKQEADREGGSDVGRQDL